MLDSALSTPREAAQYLKIPESTVGTLARRGDLPFVWLGEGRIRRFRRADLDAYIAERTRPSTRTGQAGNLADSKLAVHGDGHHESYSPA